MGATARHDSPPLQMALGMAASILLHVMLVLALPSERLPQDERFSQRAIEVTLERPAAPSALPAPMATVEAGQVRPSGSVDLVHSAMAPGPPDAANPSQPAPPPPRPTLEETLMPPQPPPVVTAHELALQALPATARSRDILDRVQAPPTSQPLPQAATRQAPPQNSAAPSTTPARGEPARWPGKAAYASEHDARQDYVLNVVRKLSHMRFYAESESAASARGVVIARLTVARDGGLVDLSLAKDSGSTGLDRSVLDTIRKAAPFTPLPNDFANSRFTFIVPINYAREQ
jgi:periplasmic protein TonB